jgi:hypothetical protein
VGPSSSRTAAHARHRCRRGRSRLGSCSPFLKSCVPPLNPVAWDARPGRAPNIPAGRQRARRYSQIRCAFGPPDRVCRRERGETSLTRSKKRASSRGEVDDVKPGARQPESRRRPRREALALAAMTPTYRERLRVEGLVLAGAGALASAGLLIAVAEASDRAASTLGQLALVAVLLAILAPRSARRALASARPVEPGERLTGEPAVAAPADPARAGDAVRRGG